MDMDKMNLMQFCSSHGISIEYIEKVLKFLTEKKENLIKYGSYYISSDLLNWNIFKDKFKDYFISFRNLGRKVFGRAVSLYYAIPNASKEERAIMVGALGYYMLTFDLIPDVYPVIGFGDDAVALDTAIRAAAKTFTPQVIRKAEETVKEWFGE